MNLAVNQIMIVLTLQHVATELASTHAQKETPVPRQHNALLKITELPARVL